MVSNQSLRFDDRRTKECAFLVLVAINMWLAFTLTLFLPEYRMWKAHSLSFMRIGHVKTDQTENGPATRHGEQRPMNHFQVYEDFLPPESLHQEGGGCRIGSKLYLIGGNNYTMHQNTRGNIGASLGGQVVTIYDMKDMSVSFGPRFPYRANHVSCAETSDGILHVTGGYQQDAPKDQQKAYNQHYVWNTSSKFAQWAPRAKLPSARGGHGCAFLKDGKLYCAGGGVDQWGPFLTDMIVYDPRLDTWSEEASMHTARDHISAMPIRDGDWWTYPFTHGGRTPRSSMVLEKSRHRGSIFS